MEQLQAPSGSHLGQEPATGGFGAGAGPAPTTAEPEAVPGASPRSAGGSGTEAGAEGRTVSKSRTLSWVGADNRCPSAMSVPTIADGLLAQLVRTAHRCPAAGAGTGGGGLALKFTVSISFMAIIYTYFTQHLVSLYSICADAAMCGDACSGGLANVGTACAPRVGRVARGSDCPRNMRTENCWRNRPWTVCRPRPDPFRRRNPPGENRPRRVAWRRAAGRLRRRLRRGLLGAQAPGSPGVPGPRRGRRVAP